MLTSCTQRYFPSGYRFTLLVSMVASGYAFFFIRVIEKVIFLRTITSELKIGKHLKFNHLPIILGDPFGARTQDPNIKSVVLYRLS